MLFFQIWSKFRNTWLSRKELKGVCIENVPLLFNQRNLMRAAVQTVKTILSLRSLLVQTHPIWYNKHLSSFMLVSLCSSKDDAQARARIWYVLWVQDIHAHPRLYGVELRHIGQYYPQIKTKQNQFQPPTDHRYKSSPNSSLGSAQSIYVGCKV